MRTVVAHRGARDDYQLALALQEAGMLECLYTDLYWPADRPWTKRLENLGGPSVKSALQARYKPGLPSRVVRTRTASGAVSLVLDKFPRAPFSVRKFATRWTDDSIGSAAGQHANRSGSAILSCSYYGYSAFASASRSAPKILFQLHPHPLSMRRILGEERAAFPECAASLNKEWELSLSAGEYQKLVDEVGMAEHWIAASSFTRTTLAENGVDPSLVHVVPYGVNLDRFQPGPEPSASRLREPLRILFVGTINQRKGIRYLLEALKSFRPDEVQLLVCGRAVDDLSLFEPFGEQARVRVSVSAEELRSAYRSADLFVFPSIGEGFGHVLLEAMASGLPILSTTHTAAPDLASDGQEGFIVPPRRPDLLVDRIRWSMRNRSEVVSMGKAARLKAEAYTWGAFRTGIANVVSAILHNEMPREKEVAAHV